MVNKKLFFRRVALPLIFVLLCSSTGCNRGSPPVASVSGQVLVDGRPLSGAIVTLEPLPGTSGPNASTSVFNGEFRLDDSAKLRGGEYRVRVALLPPELRAQIEATGQIQLPPQDSVIDPKYDSHSQLNCTLQPNTDNQIKIDVKFL